MIGGLRVGDRSGRRGLWAPWVTIALRAVVSLALLGGLLTWLSTTRIVDQIGRIPVATWVAVLVVFLVGHAVSAMKWRLLLAGAGASIDRRAALRAHAAGLFANLCLPSIVGGDLIRAGLAVRAVGRLEAVALGSLADRLIDTAALVGIAGATAVLHPGLVGEWAASLLVAAAVLLTLGVGAGLLVVRVVPAGRWPAPVAPVAARVGDAVDALIAVPGRAAVAFGLALLVQGSFIGLNLMLAAAIGIQVRAAAWMLAWPMAKLVALLPVSLGGIGVREVALAAFLAPFGVEAALAVAQSLAWEVVLVVGGLCAAAFTVALGGSLSLKRGRA